MTNFNDNHEPDIEELARTAQVHTPTDRRADIEADLGGAPVPGGPAPKSGATIPSGPTRYDPSTLLREEAGDAPTMLPSTGGRRGGSGQYVNSAVVSSALSDAQAAARPGSLPASQTVAPTKPMRTAFQAVESAMEEAREAVALIPTKIAEAEQARAEQVGQSEEPIALPSVSDVRAHWDAKAVEALRRVVELRKDYDATVAAEADIHHRALGKSIPTMSSDVLARVADLGAAIRDLREGVAAFVEVAGSSSPEVMPARLPRAADLSALGAIEKEVEALVAVTEAPSQPRISPTLDERRRIAAEAARVPSGLNQEILTLARRERSENFRWTEYTRGIPADVLESFARSQSTFL